MKGWLYVWFFLISCTAGAQVLQLPDSIAEQVQSDELAGDSLSDPLLFALPLKYEYIPAEETPELVADRLSCIQQTIPLTYNNNVHGFINFFTIRNREYTRLMLRRQHLYFPLFEKHLAKHQLPDELKYLSIIESGLNPRAVSRANAVGLWQFMSFTGRYFGLQNDWYLDDRMDPEKSTDAACRYMKQLYSMFGNWELALAAYNSGPGTVKRAIRRSGYKKTFWEIYRYLPKETRSYVPQFIAIIYAMNYADEHNMGDIAREEFIPHDTVTVRQFLHLETFAALTGTCTEELHALNPYIRRHAIPENGKTYIMKVPIAAKETLSQNRKMILDSASKTGRQQVEPLAAGSTTGKNSFTYTVKYGDALGLIAQRYRVQLDDLRKWNNLTSNLIRTGQKLTIWTAAAPRNPTPAPASTSGVVSVPPDKIYTVQEGDTLWDISQKFKGVTVEKLKAINNLKTNRLSPGMKLILG
ncbi:MAG: transglycosylase SLT domain-containing protein [Cytophagales bacterium]|nr:transglycosylase SLT domain-containing protein [Cytophagales bacterium]